MPEKPFFNKYPYTDFHELNLDWTLSTVQHCLEVVDAFEERVSQLETDVADLQTRMTTAEERIAQHDSDIAGLSSAVSGVRNRVTALENADIQDAAMLASVSSVEAGNASVTVNFGAATYADGVKTAGTDAAVIPAATTSKAGVMIPGEKEKLNAFSVDGSGNATFSGKVSGDGPTAAGDYTTKSYVDSLAISGSAAVTTEASGTDITWKEGLTAVDYDNSIMRSYGKVVQFDFWINHTLDEARSYGASMFGAHLPLACYGSYRGQIMLWNDTDQTLIPAHIQTSQAAPGADFFHINIIPEISVAAEKKIIVYGSLTYFMNN